MGGKRSRPTRTNASGSTEERLAGIKRKYTNGKSGGPFLEKYRPSPAWVDTCGVIVETLNIMIQHSIGASWRVMPQGSFVQGLQVNGSDLDLVLLDGSNRWYSMNRRKNADELDYVVRRICGSWSQHMLKVTVIRKIYSARVPLARLRVIRGPHQVEIDMCFGDPSRGQCDQYVSRLLDRSGQQLEDFCLALKIFFNKRGLTETHTGGISCFAVVLLAIYFYHKSGPSFTEFFKGVIALRAKSNMTVSVETYSLVPRPAGAERDFMHVSVPCKPGENAARCLTVSVWTRKVYPELARAVEISGSIPKERSDDFDFVLDKLLSGDQRRYSVPLEVTESESSSSSSGDEWIEAKPWSEDEAPPVEKKTTDEEVIDLEKRGNRSNPGGPIQIHECDSCEFFSFNQSDLLNHRFTVHRYPEQSETSERTPQKYRLPRNYNQRSHMYAATPQGGQKKRQRREEEEYSSDYF